MVSVQAWQRLLEYELQQRAALSPRRLGVILTLRCSVRFVGFINDVSSTSSFVKLSQSDGAVYVDLAEVAAIEVKK